MVNLVSIALQLAKLVGWVGISPWPEIAGDAAATLARKECKELLQGGHQTT